MSFGRGARPRTTALWAGLFLRLSAREFQIAALFALFPALLAIVYASAYNPSAGGLALSAIVVSGDRDDRGALILDDSAMTVYESADLGAAMRALRDGSVDAVVESPAASNEDSARIYIDPASGMGPYAESLVRAAAASAFGGARAESAWRTTASFTRGSGGSNDFLVAVPGLFVFGWTFGAMTTALIAVREVRRRSIDRAVLAGARASEMAAGLWIAQACLGLLQAAALWAVLPLCGFPSPARPLDAALVVLVLNALMSAVATACGLATAALCSSEGVAVNLCMVFIAPLAFLSGAVFPLPSPSLFELGGYSFAAIDFLPSAPATKALELALARGSGFAAAAPALAAAAAGSALWAAGGAALFGRMRLSPRRRPSWDHR